MGNYQNKTLPHLCSNVGKRNENICQNGRRVPGIPIVAKPADISIPLVTVPVQIQNVTVTVRVAEIVYHAVNIATPKMFSGLSVVVPSPKYALI